MAARGFAPDALGDATVRQQGTDAKGHATATSVQFAMLFEGGGDARLTVDLSRGIVTGGTLGLPPSKPSGPGPEYRVSLEEARALAERAIVARGSAHYEIVSAREWHPPYEATLGAPYYILTVNRDLPAPEGKIGASVREMWFVNGATGATYHDDELPALKERMEAMYRAGEERNRATPGTATPPAPAVPSTP